MFSKILFASFATVLLALPSVALAKAKKGSDASRAFAQVQSVRAQKNHCLVATHAVIGPNGNVIACEPTLTARGMAWTDYLLRSGAK